MSRSRFQILLIVLLTLMISGYFTVSENVTITRGVKIFLRVSMSLFAYMLYRIISRQYVAAFEKENRLIEIFYYMYLLLGFASLLWSTKPGYSLLQLIMTSQSLVFVYFFVKSIMLYNHYNSKNKVNFHLVIGYSVFWIILVFVCGRWINPDSFFRLTHGGDVARLGGYFMNPNELGMLAVIGLGMLLMDIYVRGLKPATIFVFLILLYALILTGSRSSMIGFLTIVLYFVLKSKNTKLKVGVLSLVFLSIPVIVNMIFIKQGDLEEVLSMTGRLPFWKALLTEGLPKEPFFGFGFMRIAYTDSFQSVHTYAGHMTHNTFIQVLMNLGFVGLFIVILQMTVTIRASIVSNNSYFSTLFTGVFIPIIINSFTEFGIYGETNFGILFWQLIMFLFIFRFAKHMTIKQRVKLKSNPIEY